MTLKYMAKLGNLWAPANHISLFDGPSLPVFPPSRPPAEEVNAFANWNAPLDLQVFLQQGEPVVSIGFGSMSSSKAEQVTDLVQRAARVAGVRVVLLVGSGGLKAAGHSDRLFCLREALHEWLLQRVSAIVHHGGAGTTAAALRSGVPNLVVPFGVDQPFWGSRVKALGVGPEPLPHSRLTLERLSKALKVMVSDQAMRMRAAQLGALLRSEDGVAEAVKHFDGLSTNV
jgi:UDP:flavonoid glycosyltransferase YjiC (YdhE family)